MARIRMLGLLVLPMLWGCPFQASFEPSGPLAPLRGAVIGEWSCHVDDDPEELRFTIGWSGGSRYVVEVAAPAPAPPVDATGAVRLEAVARTIRGREVWSLWTEPLPGRSREIFFAALESARPGALRFALFEEAASPPRSAPASPKELAERLVARDLMPDELIECTRPSAE